MSTWENFKEQYFSNRNLGFHLDRSRVGLTSNFHQEIAPKLAKAFSSMADLESGAKANPDEDRMVGHYWLRNSSLAPSDELKNEIETAKKSILEFAEQIHQGKILSSTGSKFSSALIVGIGGSALGPQFASRALKTASSKFKLHFFDNTDPDGMELVLSDIEDPAATLCVIVSKSGGTVETRNGMLAAKAFFESKNLDFSKHAVAVTGVGSKLDKLASDESWITRFPIWDWVGGRTSQLGPVGLLPAALEGHDVDALLDGAGQMDELTRKSSLDENPAAQLAACWYFLGSGKGERNMVLLPYRDRLEYISRYLQQLVMESLGKELDLDGNKVDQGISVYGNKGSTDQHAYVQQLRDGRDDFFVTFIDVKNDLAATASNLEIEDGVSVGDYLFGFYRGTREALSEKNRPSITITLDSFSEKELGMLIALFERAVGLYASLINVNAYHQPGVEAGKKAAGGVIELQKKVLTCLAANDSYQTVEEVAQEIGDDSLREDIFSILQRLAATGRASTEQGSTIFEDRFKLKL